MSKNDAAIEQPPDLAELARQYRKAKDAADLARESVKPAAKAASEAKAALTAALKGAGTPIVVDGRLYRIQGNGQMATDEVEVLGS